MQRGCFKFGVSIPANIYLFKVTIETVDARKRCEICLKLTRETPERRQWRSGVFIMVSPPTLLKFF